MLNVKVTQFFFATWLASTSMPALAQIAAPAQTPDEQSIATLEEIVVTAQKRSERLQDVPISVSALSSDSLAANDVKSLQDLTGTVPGFVATNSVNYGAAPLSIRGVGGANGGGNFFNDEPVAVYVDGIYIGRLSFSTSDLLDIDSIQVLRGPQGTLYGRNSTAGALLVAAKRPTDSLNGYVQAGYTSLDDFRIGGAIAGPLASDKLTARLALSYSDRKGFWTNTYTGKKAGGSEDFSGRLSLQFRPTEKLTFDLIGEYLDQNAEPVTVRVSNVSNSATDSPFLVRSDLNQALKDNETAFNDPNIFKAKTKSVTLLGEWELDGLTVNSLSNWRSWDSTGAQDSDGDVLIGANGAPLHFTNSGVFRNDQYSQELRLSSDADKPFSWIIGGFYLHENNAVDPFTINNPNGAGGLGTSASFTAFQKLDAYAAFADATFKISDQFSVIGGIRYSYEQKEFQNTQRVVTIVGTPTRPAGSVLSAPPTVNYQRSWDDVTYRAVANYKPTVDVLVYASFSTGFKSGGFNAFGLTDAFNPEQITAYEAGVKSEWLDRRLRLNSALFRYDYTDLQVRLPVPTGGVNIQNAASARSQGVELESVILPAEGVRLTANVAYLDAKFTSGVLPAVPVTARYRIGTNVPLVDQDITGNRLTRAPEWQVYLGADYETAIGTIGTGRFQISYTYQSEVFYSETNQDEATFRADGWDEVGARFTLTAPEDRWHLTVYAENIFNNRHLTQVTALSSFPNGSVNEPRRFGVQLGVNF